MALGRQVAKGKSILDNTPPVNSPLTWLMLEVPGLWLLLPYSSRLTAALLAAFYTEGSEGTGLYSLMHVSRVGPPCMHDLLSACLPVSSCAWNPFTLAHAACGSHTALGTTSSSHRATRLSAPWACLPSTSTPPAPLSHQMWQQTYMSQRTTQ